VRKFIRKLIILFKGNFIEDVDYINMLKSNLEGKAFLDDYGNHCVIRDGELLYSKDKGENWIKASSWEAVKDNKGKVHIVYMSRALEHPRFDIGYFKGN
jgi:hypothetical protein